MYEALLREQGLSVNEAKIYEALLKAGEASANTLSIKTKVSRSNVYNAMERLIDKGLASEFSTTSQRNYRAAHPRRFLELLKQKQEDVEKALPKLTSYFEANVEDEEVHFFKGIEGYKNYMFEIVKQKQPYYCIGGKGMWFDPRMKHFRMRFDRERKKVGITFKHLFDEEVKTKAPYPLRFDMNESRFIPKKFCSKLTMEIFGPYSVIYTGEEYGKLKEEPTIFVLKSKDIAEGFVKLFNLLWEKCPAE